MSEPAESASDHRLVQALEHPARAAFLRLLAGRRTLSANEALPLPGQPGLGRAKVAYHARVLNRLGLIEPTEESEPDGGSRFRLTQQGRAALVALGIPDQEGES